MSDYSEVSYKFNRHFFEISNSLSITCSIYWNFKEGTDLCNTHDNRKLQRFWLAIGEFVQVVDSIEWILSSVRIALVLLLPNSKEEHRAPYTVLVCCRYTVALTVEEGA